jgi:hypothetical protein
LTEKIEQKAIQKLTSVGSVLKNPFKNLEEILSQLGELEGDSQGEIKSIQKKELSYQTVGKEARKAVIAVEEEYENPSESLNKVLKDLGEMFEVCGICGNGTMKNELISGVCFDCYRKGELIDAQNKRIGELEAQVRNMESKINNSSPQDYMSDIIDEILATIRRDIENDLQSLKTSLPNAQITPPPPPPPSGILKEDDPHSTSNINFSNMTLEEMKQFSPKFLSELPLSLRNNYNSRLKELKMLEKMTPKQKREYYRKKKKEQENAANLDELVESLKKLSESDNHLFLKMKKQAEKSVLKGQGTLGSFKQKKVFVLCQNCNTTNKILEGKITPCEKCHAPLTA